MEIRFNRKLEEAVLIILKLLGAFMLRKLGLITVLSNKFEILASLDRLESLEYEDK